MISAEILVDSAAEGSIGWGSCVLRSWSLVVRLSTKSRHPSILKGLLREKFFGKEKKIFIFFSFSGYFSKCLQGCCYLQLQSIVSALFLFCSQFWSRTTSSTQSQQFSDFWCSSKSHKSLWQSVRHQLTGAIVQGFNERETYSIACCMLRLHYTSITETTKKDTIEMGCHCQLRQGKAQLATFTTKLLMRKAEDHSWTMNSKPSE